MSLSPRRFALSTATLLAVAICLGALIAHGLARPDPTPAARPLTYVAIGASDSVGVGASLPETESWVAVLHDRLPAGSRLVNLGVSGSLLRQALDQQLPVAIDADPDLVTVWLAVNDLNARVPLERYSGELDALLRALREKTHATVAVGNVPDVSQLPAYQQLDPALVRREVERWNVAIAGVVERHGAVLVDLHRDWQELADYPEYVGRDGFHPSTEGYRRLAEIFLDVLAERTEIL